MGNGSGRYRLTTAKHHPHRVGSFSYHTTKIVNGKVESHSSTGSFCAK
jgi:hypothetical protein